MDGEGSRLAGVQASCLHVPAPQACGGATENEKRTHVRESFPTARPDRTIAVDADDKTRAESFRLFQKVDMARMNDVEAAVRENDHFLWWSKNPRQTQGPGKR